MEAIEEPEGLETRELERIQAVTAEIVAKSSARPGSCVYRGEPECYEVVSSGLYRKCPERTHEAFDIGRVEQEIIESARQYTSLTNETEILAEIQHYGGKTNLIDFTTDYLVALFFACAGGDGKDGRVVLQWPDQGTVVEPRQKNNRIISQKSVFVRPWRGFIVPSARDETVVVPSDLKEGLLSFLARFHGISERTVYNDIHGFIRNQDLDESPYIREFRMSPGEPESDGVEYLKRCSGDETILDVEIERMRHAYHQIGMVYQKDERSMFVIRRWVREIVEVAFVSLDVAGVVFLYTGAIEKAQGGVRPDEAYCGRGEAYLFQGATDRAIRDFEEALARNKELAQAYRGRGNAHRKGGDEERGMEDLNEALRLQPGLVAALIDRGNAYRENGSLEEALTDYDEAISTGLVAGNRQVTSVGDRHFYRAIARCALEDWEGMKEDIIVARRDGILVASSFRNILGDVPTFEAEYGVRVPSHIVTELHVPVDALC